MNTIDVNDMTRAISRPTYRSRTIAIATTRPDAAPTPWMKRATRSVVRSLRHEGEHAPAEIDDKPGQECRTAPGNVGERPVAELGDAETEQVDEHDELRRVRVRHAELVPDRA
jgi:hypothetical protein